MQGGCSVNQGNLQTTNVIDTLRRHLPDATDGKSNRDGDMAESSQKLKNVDGAWLGRCRNMAAICHISSDLESTRCHIVGPGLGSAKRLIDSEDSSTPLNGQVRNLHDETTRAVGREMHSITD